MKRRRTLILLGALGTLGAAGASSGFAQGSNVVFHTQVQGQIPDGGGVTVMERPVAPVQGAPYSATMSVISVQTLADGNRIVQSTTGGTARDSQGRTRHDTTLPPIGNLTPADAPHIAFVVDPVAQTSYTLNLTEKTAQKVPMPPAGGAVITAGGPATAAKLQGNVSIAAAGPGVAVPLPPGTPPPGGFFLQTFAAGGDPSQTTTEDLGSETMEGVPVTGVRTMRTIPAGEIGNDKPITIVTEVWTSPDLKMVVYSKRDDPRMGEQTFQLTNIVRSEPDPSLFTVPADFKIIDAPQPTVLYRQKQ
jgi:hypothetical protein